MDARTELDLIHRQLAAIDAWTAEHAEPQDVGEVVALTREMRLDAGRRLQARRREQEAVLARAAQHLAASGALLHDRVPVRAVLAHRNEWLRGKVATSLEAAGIVVVGQYEDGADAAGTIVVEQPDVVLVEDRLPTLEGLEVVRRTRRFAPRAVVGAQVTDGSAVGSAFDAGAHAVFTRRTPPADIAAELLRCLTAGDHVLT